MNHGFWRQILQIFSAVSHGLYDWICGENSAHMDT